MRKFLRKTTVFLRKIQDKSLRSSRAFGVGAFALFLTAYSKVFCADTNTRTVASFASKVKQEIDKIWVEHPQILYIVGILGGAFCIFLLSKKKMFFAGLTIVLLIAVMNLPELAAWAVGHRVKVAPTGF